MSNLSWLLGNPGGLKPVPSRPGRERKAGPQQRRAPRQGGVILYRLTRNPLQVSRHIVASLTDHPAFVNAAGPNGRYDPIVDVIRNGEKNLSLIGSDPRRTHSLRPHDTPAFLSSEDTAARAQVTSILLRSSYGVSGVINHTHELCYIFVPIRRQLPSCQLATTFHRE